MDHKTKQNEMPVMGLFATFLFVGMDLETTGLDSKAEPIDLGCEVSIQRRTPIDQVAFEQLIQPTVRIPYEVTHITGITHTMLDDAKAVPLQQAWSKWCKWLSMVRGDKNPRPVLLCGHNLVHYDLPLLCGCLHRFGIDLDAMSTLSKCGVVRVLDTLAWAQERLKDLPNHKLATVYEHVTKRKLEGAHRARADARAALEIVLALSPDEVNIFAIPFTPATLKDNQHFCEACGTICLQSEAIHHAKQCKWPIVLQQQQQSTDNK
jgi:DNA polymerase III alpha subunit (gram-positive type)